jgi:hypothetical protein
MINLFFFFGPTPPPQMSLGDIFEVRQGKNSFYKQKENDSLSKDKEALLLTLNSIDFDIAYIEKTKLLPCVFSEKNDRKYVLQPTDFLINRVGNSKTMSMLMNNNFDKETIVISQNFIYARPKKLFSNIPLTYLHFLLKICVDILSTGKNEKVTKQAYLTVKHIQDIKIPVNLLENNPENDELYKNFEKLNNELYNSYSKVINSIISLNVQKAKLEKFKKEHFESAVELVNQRNENE